MRPEAEKVYEAAVALSEEQRAELVVKLLDSMAQSMRGAQARESLSRLAALDAGELETLDHDAAMRMISG
jgi:hypothetical protein